MHKIQDANPMFGKNPKKFGGLFNAVLNNFYASVGKLWRKTVAKVQKKMF